MEPNRCRALRRTQMLVVLVMALLALLTGGAVWAMAAQSSNDPAGEPVADGADIFLPVIFNRFSTTPPEILSFLAVPATIYEGETAVLQWNIESWWSALSITPDVTVAVADASVAVSPSRTVTYELTATNDYGTDTAQTVLTVLPPKNPPTIVAFGAAPLTINEGETTALTWQLDGVYDSVSISPGVGDVTGLTTVDVSPLTTTVYELTAVNRTGTTKKQVTVTVINPPLITSLSSDMGTINEGESATLSWTIDNPVTTLTLTPDTGSVTGQNSQAVSPLTTTEYTLTAVNSAGSDSATIEITVINPPEIVEFTATSTTVVNGQSTKLLWTVTGDYTSLTITPDVGDVAGLTEVTISPAQSATYTLTAVNNAVQSTAQVDIEVVESLQLVVFDWDKEVTKNHSGFPRSQPPLANGDWTAPVDFAQGTLYFRAKVISQPVAQEDMQLQFCFWQEEDGDNFKREQCASKQTVPGNPNTVRCWSTPMKNMWIVTHDGQKYPIEWDRARFRTAFAIKKINSDIPISDYEDFNWSGENPDEWYPLDIELNVIVVAPGESFTWWSDCP